MKKECEYQRKQLCICYSIIHPQGEKKGKTAWGNEQDGVTTGTTTGQETR